MYLSNQIPLLAKKGKTARKPDPGLEGRGQAVRIRKACGAGQRGSRSRPGGGKTTRYRRSGCPDTAGERGPPAAFCISEQSNIEENSHSVYRVQGKYNKKSNKYKKIIKHVRTLFFVVVNVSGVCRRCQKRSGTQENTTYCACKKRKTGVYFASLKKNICIGFETCR